MNDLVRDERTDLPFDTAGINTHGYSSTLKAWDLAAQAQSLSAHLYLATLSDMSCIVEGCAAPATESVSLPPLTGKEVEDFGPWEVVACAFHAQALRSGEAFSETDHGNFRLGTDGVPPRLLEMSLHERGLTYPVMKLGLGHDGIVSDEVEIQISPELHRYLFLNADSELQQEIERNHSRPEPRR